MNEISMDYNMKTEDTFIQVRDKLQKEGIKLWLAPYYCTNVGSAENELHVCTKLIKKIRICFILILEIGGGLFSIT